MKQKLHTWSPRPHQLVEYVCDLILLVWVAVCVCMYTMSACVCVCVSVGHCLLTDESCAVRGLLTDL